ncbi:MAG: cupin domain-containing protein [Desulfobaccales bacterium]
MFKKHYTEVPQTVIDKEGFEGMVARFALTKDDGCPHYAMRIMEFKPGGHTSLHAHQEEHEFYFLEGDGELLDGKGQKIPLRPGDLAYTAPNEAHQINNVGDTALRVLCTIPILPGGDGKATTMPAPIQETE